MAGDWIKMRLDLAEDPAVIRMAEELGCREETIVGYCHAFWAWVSRQCDAASVTGVTLTALGRRLNLPGFPELMVQVGWLEYDDSGELPVIRVPHFDRHLSESAKKRANTAKRMGKLRCANSDAASVTKSAPEKRREEKSKGKVSNDTLQSSASGTSTARTEYGFPLKGGGTWYLTERKHQEYLDAYADIDVCQQYTAARQWLRDNPHKRKTATGMLKYLTGWLNRQLDATGGSKRKNGRRQPTAPQQPPWAAYRDRAIMADRTDTALRSLTDEEWQKRYAMQNSSGAAKG